MDDETRRELQRVEAMAKEGLIVAYRSESAGSKHEAVCAERYGNLKELLEGMREDLRSARSLPWKYVAGACMLIGTLYTIINLLGK